MAITPPTLRPSDAAQARRQGSAPASAQSVKIRSSSASDAAAASADAQSQIAAANRTVTDARTEAQVQLDRIQADYDTQTEAQIQRDGTTLEKERLKGYEALRELQHQQQEQLSHLRREGERSLGEMKEYYQGSLIQTERKGEQDLRATRSRTQAAALNEQGATTQELQQEKASHLDRVGRLKQSDDEQELRFTEASQKEQARTRDASTQAIQKSHQVFEQREADVRTQTDAELASIMNSSNLELQRLRQDTSQKLDAYASRSGDPFYRLVNTDARLEETDDGYELRARIPVHEREHLTASVSGNELILSGSRRNEEKLEIEPGRNQSTSSYQSFRESFPLTFPVDAKLLTREFEGDELVVRVPKSGKAFEAPKRPVAKPERVRLERPDFPKNLPIAAAKDVDEDPRITESRERARAASRPLTS